MSGLRTDIPSWSVWMKADETAPVYYREVETQMEIRYEKPGDIPAIRSVHQAAFETGAEADLVDVLRDKKAHGPDQQN